MFNAKAVAARRTETALALLPKMFDSLRAAFGATGPSVMPLQKVRHATLACTVKSEIDDISPS